MATTLQRLRNTKSLGRAASLGYLACVVIYMFYTFSWVSYLSQYELIANIYQTFSTTYFAYFPPLLFVLLIIEAYSGEINLKRTLIGILAAFLVFALPDGLINNTNRNLVYLVFLIIAYPKNLSVRDVAELVWRVGALLILITIAVSLNGLIPEGSYPRWEHNTIRYTWGFGYWPNGFAIYVSAIIMVWVYCRSFAWRWYYSVVAGLLLYCVYLIADGRGSISLGLIQVVLTQLCNSSHIGARIKHAIKKLVFICATWLFTVMAVLSHLAPLFLSLLNENQLGYLHQLTSSRTTQWLLYYNEYGYHLFGQRIDVQIANGVFDNLYLFYGMLTGLLFLSLFCFLYIRCGKYCERNDDVYMGIFISLLALHCLVENHVFYFADINISIFAIGAMLAGASLYKAPKKAPAVANEQLCPSS